MKTNKKQQQTFLRLFKNLSQPARNISVHLYVFHCRASKVPVPFAQLLRLVRGFTVCIQKRLDVNSKTQAKIQTFRPTGSVKMDF